MRIQFLKDHNGYVKGQVLNVDGGSGKSLVDGKFAEEYAGKKKRVVPPQRPGVVHVATVGANDPGPGTSKATKSADDDEDEDPPAETPAARTTAK